MILETIFVESIHQNKDSRIENLTYFNSTKPKDGRIFVVLFFLFFSFVTLAIRNQRPNVLVLVFALSNISVNLRLSSCTITNYGPHRMSYSWRRVNKCF